MRASGAAAWLCGVILICVLRHRVLISSIRQQRMLKMMAIADDRQFSYQNEDDLVDFASEMQNEGLDVNNEENLDSYLNTKFM
jgi:hypothetical protein